MSEGTNAAPSISDDDAYDRLFRPDVEEEVRIIPARAGRGKPAPGEAQENRILIDTGRLFRSTRVQVDTAALPALTAITATDAAKLRTIRPDSDIAPYEIPASPAAAVAAPLAYEKYESYERPAVAQEPRPLSGFFAEPISIPPEYDDEVDPMYGSLRSEGLKAGLVYAIVIGATVVAGLAGALLGGALYGVLSGGVLVIASCFAALRVRPSDSSVAIIAPPIAYLLVSITAGQVGQTGSGGLIGRLMDVFFTMGSGWFWVVGATVAALVIIIVRRRTAA